MKKHLIFLLVLNAIAISSYCQSPVGLIAHWTMDGNTNDVTGNGHNGHGSNVTLTTGKDGIPNTAYYFNGINSMITAPYMPDLNVSKFSICATVKVMGFYSGTCQSNTIFGRGAYSGHTHGSYGLSFDDNQADSNCLHIDSTVDVFWGAAPYVPPHYYDAFYTPTISKNVWYTVVVTLNDTVFKTYVNGILKTSYSVSSPFGAIGTSTDSMSIGYDIYEAPTYSYPFNGAIDDVMLYNRVLSDTEIAHYGTTGINPLSEGAEVEVFPNPVQSSILVRVSDNAFPCNMALFNLQGQLIAERELVAKETTTDLSKVPSGLYLLKVQVGDQVFYKKVMKE